MNICGKCDTINLDTAARCTTCDNPLASHEPGSAVTDDAIGAGYLAALQTRPTSVTVLCWLIIVFSVIGLMRMPAQLAAPMAHQIIHWLYFDLVLIALNLVCAFAMLAGQSWGRTLTVLLRTVGLIGAFVIAPLAGILGLAFYVIILAILYSQDANAYFSRTRSSL